MIIAILLLAGKGLRLDKNNPKQFIKINNKELFLYSLNTFLKIKKINHFILVVSKNDYFKVQNILKREKILNENISLVIGGDSRNESTFNALKYIKANFNNVDTVLIHDSARALVSKSIINRNIKASYSYPCITTYIDEVDTIVESSNNEIKNYLKREKIKRIQTPQTFNFDLIYNLSLKNEKNYTDDTIICKKNGYNIKLVKGSSLNFKITTKKDLILLKDLINNYE